jgi:DNA primase catalytic core
MAEDTATSPLPFVPKNWWRDAALVERLKRDADLIGMVRSHGVDLKPQGADLVACCPFHAEKTPSFHVTPSKNLWRCFGCGKGGSAVDWIVSVSGCSIREAFDQLRIQQGEMDPSASKPREWVESTFAPDPDWDEARLLREAASYYASRLEASPLAQDYLRRRGLWDLDLVRRYQLGFADRTLGLSIGKSASQRNTRLREQLASAGLMRESGHEHFTGCVVAPILGELDADGIRSIQGMYGRRVNPCSRPGQVPHLYLKGAHRGIFNAEAVKSSGADTVILCEAILDALTFVRWGWESVTCAYGVRGVTPDLWQFLTTSGFRRVVIAFDADAAGDEAARDLAPRLHAEGLEVQRLALPAGLDVNDVSLRSNDPARTLQQALDGAAWMSAELYPDRPVNLGRRAPESAETETVGVSAILDVETGAAQQSFLLAAEGSAAAPVVMAPAPKAFADAPEDATLPASAAVRSLAEGPALPPVPALEGDTGTVDATFGDRAWRVKGLLRNRSDDVLRVTVRVMRTGLSSSSGAFHLDTLDLYQAKSREAFARTASAELGLAAEVVRADLARLVVRLEEVQKVALQAASQPPAPVRAQLTASERDEASALLRRPDMLQQLLSDLAASGMVGEEGNKLLCFLALTSRRLEAPLGLLIQSTSAAGKSSLLDGILRVMPDEEVVRYSAMSGQALFYMGGVSLKHKILCVAEEEGARRASYSLKLLQSDGELTMASTGKDPESGQLVTKEYKTQGPVALVMTTTSIDIDPELQNRCLVLSVDESREQTEAIHHVQRQGRTREGQARRHDAAHRLAVWRNAQRLLEPMTVVNPYAEALTFASHCTRTRRDMAKYLTLVEAVALAHQHQKPRRFDSRGSYIEVDLDDIELANLLASQALGRNLAELPPQTAELLHQLGALVLAESQAQGVGVDLVGFSRRWVRERTHWGDTQLKVHLRRLEELEYLTLRKSGHGAFEYRFSGLSVGLDGSILAGLLDVATLRTRCPDAPYHGTWMHGAWKRAVIQAADLGESVGAVGVRSGEGRPICGHTPDASEAPPNASLEAVTESRNDVKSELVGVGGETRIKTEYGINRSPLVVLPDEVVAPPTAPPVGVNGHQKSVPELVA